MLSQYAPQTRALASRLFDLPQKLPGAPLQKRLRRLIKKVRSKFLIVSAPTTPEQKRMRTAVTKSDRSSEPGSKGIHLLLALVKTRVISPNAKAKSAKKRSNHRAKREHRSAKVVSHRAPPTPLKLSVRLLLSEPLGLKKP